MLVNLYEDMSLTRPSKQCKTLIDVLIQRQYLEKDPFLRRSEQWRRKTSFCGEDKKRGEGKGGKYLVNENIWSTEEKKTGEGKRGIIWRRKINGDANRPTNLVNIVQSVFSKVRK